MYRFLAKVYLVRYVVYQSFLSLLIPLTAQHAQPDMKLMILGNKCDLEESRVVTEQEGRILAAKYGADFFETSAMSDLNVAEAIVALAKTIIDQMSVGGLWGWDHTL